VSRKASRAAITARRRAIAARRERAQGARAADPDATAPPTLDPAATRRAPRGRPAPGSAPPVLTAKTARQDRLWTVLLIGGAAVAFGLLGRQVADIVQDRARPMFLHNDIYSALASVAMLAIIALFAYIRRSRRL